MLRWLNEWVNTWQELWFGGGSNIQMLRMEQCGKQWFGRQELLLALRCYLNLDLCSLDLWPNCKMSGLNTSCMVTSGEIYEALLNGTTVSSLFNQIKMYCLYWMKSSSVPKSVIIITDLNISLSYAIHKDITLAVVQLWISGCVWVVGLNWWRSHEKQVERK